MRQNIESDIPWVPIITVVLFMLLCIIVAVFVIMDEVRSIKANVTEIERHAPISYSEAKEVQDSLVIEIEEVDWIEMREVEVTYYAPLDPDAVEGMCYSGDPTITASGENVVVGDTVAAGHSVPFHTNVYVDGQGWFTVHDRGAWIGDDSIDIAVHTLEEADRKGRHKDIAIFFYPENFHNAIKDIADRK